MQLPTHVVLCTQWLLHGVCVQCCKSLDACRHCLVVSQLVAHTLSNGSPADAAGNTEELTTRAALTCALVGFTHATCAVRVYTNKAAQVQLQSVQFIRAPGKQASWCPHQCESSPAWCCKMEKSRVLLEGGQMWHNCTQQAVQSVPLHGDTADLQKQCVPA